MKGEKALLEQVAYLEKHTCCNWKSSPKMDPVPIKIVIFFYHHSDNYTSALCY